MIPIPEDRPLRILVAGSRHFRRMDLVVDYVWGWSQWRQGAVEIVVGTEPPHDYVPVAARPAGGRGRRIGVDEEAYLEAKQCGLGVLVFPAAWEAEGKAAGPIRNAQMAQYADCAAIFWDGVSAGTRSMIELMAKRDKPFRIFTPWDQTPAARRKPRPLPAAAAIIT